MSTSFQGVEVDPLRVLMLTLVNTHYCHLSPLSILALERPYQVHLHQGRLVCDFLKTNA